MVLNRVHIEIPDISIDVDDLSRLSYYIYGDSGQGKLTSARCVRSRTALGDEAPIFLLDDQYVLLLSSADFPDAMACQAAAMTAMRNHLPPSAARAILPIVAEGHLGGRSFLIIPKCTPLATGRIGRRVDRRRIRGPILHWLRTVAELAQPGSDHTTAEFGRSLAALSAFAELPDVVRNDARRMVDLLDRGVILPRHQPMHGDLWSGNIMFQDDGNLAIIDWAGSTLQGYGVFDLIRLAQSFQLSGRRLAKELEWHQARLGATKDALMLHLLGALGHYALRLGQFPRERFVAMATSCHASLAKCQ